MKNPDHPTIVAHRGGAALRAENSRSAFAHALDLGIHHLETDLQITADGVVVCWHDDDLGRLGEPKKKVWSSHSRDVVGRPLQDLGPVENDDPGLLTLEELLDLGDRAFFYLEWKSPHQNDATRQRLVDQTIEILGHRLDQVCLISFDEIMLHRLAGRYPQWSHVFLLGEEQEHRDFHDWGMGLHQGQPSDPPALVYTCKGARDYAKAQSWRAPVWMCDDPSEARAWLNRT